jgi:hypothetical protein
VIAVDSPVLIELLSDGPRADAVEACLRQALVGGRVVVCGTTLAEICASLRGGAEVQEALEEMGIHFSPLEAKSALRAGEMHRATASAMPVTCAGSTISWSAPTPCSSATA